MISKQNKLEKLVQPKSLKGKLERKTPPKTLLSLSFDLNRGFAKMLSKTTTLESLCFSNVSMNSDTLLLISDALKANSSLKSLKIAHNRLSSNNLEILLKGVLSHPTLEYLDLSNNQLDDSIIPFICRVVDCQAERRDQVVWMYGLRNEQPSDLAYTKGLAFISLENNNLTDSGASQLARSIKDDSYLRFLGLKRNQLTSEGCKEFIHALRKNSSVISLSLEENPGFDTNIKKRLTLKLIKNIKSLRKSGYNKDEIAFYSQFVDYNIFDVEIPQKGRRLSSGRLVQGQRREEPPFQTRTEAFRKEESNCE